MGCAKSKPHRPELLQNVSFKRSGAGQSLLATRWGSEAIPVRSPERMRRLSERSLQVVLSDVTIEVAFTEYCDREGGLVPLTCWRALDAFESNLDATPRQNCDITALKTQAQALYNDFFSKEQLSKKASKKLLGILSESTVLDLRVDLGLRGDQELIGSEVSLEVVQNAFRVLHLKIHNCLKYEYLPGFLISEQFMKLQLRRNSFKGTENTPGLVTAEGAKEVKLHDQNETERAEDMEVEVDEDCDGNYKSTDIDLKESNEAGNIENASSDASAAEASSVMSDQSKNMYFFEFMHKAASIDGIDPKLRKRPRARRRSHFLSQQVPVVELHQELETLLEEDKNKETKAKRLSLIFQRYASPASNLIDPPIVALSSLAEGLDLSNVENLPDDLSASLEPVRTEVLRRIGHRVLPEFKRSETYKMMMRSTSGDLAAVKVPKSHSKLPPQEPRFSPQLGSDLPIEVDGALEPLNKETVSNLDSLERFGNDVNVPPSLFGFSKPVNRSVTMDEILSNSFGIMQFKRFARKLFQEENVLFLVRVRQFKEDVHAATHHDVYEVLHAAQSICEQFVQTGCPLEVNISYEQRTQTLKAFEDVSRKFYDSLKERRLEQIEWKQEIEGIFDVARQEVNSIIEKGGLWLRFTEDEMFQEYMKKRSQFYFRPMPTLQEN